MKTIKLEDDLYQRLKKVAESDFRTAPEEIQFLTEERAYQIAARDKARATEVE